MQGNELQLIMAALESHRKEQRADLAEFKEEMRCEVKRYGELVGEHERRFQAVDAVAHFSKVAAGVVATAAGAVWAVFTFWKGH